jgi:Ca-activated chloride channel family protein
MSFAAPAFLAGLVVLPALVAWYVGRQRDRQTAATAFAARHLAESVSPNRPRWRRHAPMLALLAAVAALVVAAARPRTTVAVPAEHAAIMLATDVSGSMQAADVKPTRLAAARGAAKRFVAGVPKQVNVGVMAFNQAPRVLQSPTLDRGAVNAALDRLTPSGGTATGTAIEAATRILERTPGVNGKRAPVAIVLLSDGKSTRGVAPLAAARAAGRERIPVYTVALGTQKGTILVDGRPRTVPPDPQSLARVARASGGEAYTASDADRLKQVYERLGSQLGRRKERREVTAAFAGAGLVLLLLSSAMSLSWFGRLV